MKPEIKKLWVDALRSGGYKQTKYALHRPVEQSFCCLGVLCELAYEKGVVRQRREEDGVVAYDGEAGTLPESVKAWAGINSDSGLLPAGAEYVSLAVANDRDNTFPQIADYIERYF